MEFIDRSRNCKVSRWHMEAKMAEKDISNPCKVRFVTTKEEPWPDGEQVTPLQSHGFEVAFHLMFLLRKLFQLLLLTTLEIFIMMAS